MVIPGSVPWDGINNNGKISPEGSYYAILKVVYTKGNIAEQRTEETVLLDVTEPEVSLTMTSREFSPNNDGENDTLSIKIEASDNNTIKKWVGIINDPQGNEFQRLSGIGYPPELIVWDGSSEKGELVQSIESYPLNVEVEDESGNIATIRRRISVDAFVENVEGKLKILVSSLIFAPDTAIFKEFSGYTS
ncbi:MAG: hypothetical protein PF693_17165, partial [Spirochaetia bacterium]|nr:hypothetical protein [Spirochaetia bacterium]